MKDLTGAFDTLAKEAGTVQDEINKIRGELCKDVGTCAEETVVKPYAKGSTSLSLTSVSNGPSVGKPYIGTRVCQSQGRGRRNRRDNLEVGQVD